VKVNIYKNKRINEDEMKAPERITIAMDEDTFEVFKKLKEDLAKLRVRVLHDLNR